MIHGLSDYEKIKVIRPLPEGYQYDQFHMPIMKKVSETELDFQRLKALNIQNLSNRYDNSDKLILPFSYDKSLLRYWNDPLKYIPLLQTVMAAGTPDYSAYPTMNPIEISHNIYQNRWLGCLWQSYGCRMIPTVAWALPDTFDICFSGVEYGSIVLISTIGCTTHLPEFYQGYNEMMSRINPSLVIVYGDMFPDMYGRFVHFRYTDSFNNQNSPYKQQTLFDISPIFERKRGA